MRRVDGSLQPFEGGGDEPFLEGVPVGWDEGMAQAPGIVAAGISDRGRASPSTSSEHGAPVKEIARSTEWLGLAGVRARPAASSWRRCSADGTLARAPARRARRHHAPVGADRRSAHGCRGRRARRRLERGARHARGRPSRATSGSRSPTSPPIAPRRRIWDLADRRLDRPRPRAPRRRRRRRLVAGAARSSCCVHAFDGRHRAVPVRPRERRRRPGSTRRRGTIDDARVRPDGRVWFRHTDGERTLPRPRRRRRRADRASRSRRRPGGRSGTGATRTTTARRSTAGSSSPRARARIRSWSSSTADRTGSTRTATCPEVQAYVDAGFLVAMPNYRGSTGYGRAWRDALTGDPGFTDVDDVTAGLRDVLRRDRRRRDRGP